MSISYSGTSNGTAFNLTASYNVIYASGSGASRVYKVAVNETGSSGSSSSITAETATVWLRANGSVIATEYAGANLTGMEATLGASLFYGFVTQLPTYNNIQEYTSSTYVHKVNTTSATFGPTTMTVTNYAANSLPETVTTCSGTVTLQSFALQTGAVPGTSLSLLTKESLTATSNGSTDTFVLRLLSVTKASY
jgi:hypothetical protein